MEKFIIYYTCKTIVINNCIIFINKGKNYCLWSRCINFVSQIVFKWEEFGDDWTLSAVWIRKERNNDINNARLVNDTKFSFREIVKFQPKIYWCAEEKKIFQQLINVRLFFFTLRKVMKCDNFEWESGSSFILQTTVSNE